MSYGCLKSYNYKKNGWTRNTAPFITFQIWTLVGTYLLMASIGVCLAVFFLDNIPDALQDDVSASTVWQETKELLIATLKSNRSPVMLLVIQRYLFSSFFTALFVADWPRVGGFSNHGMPFEN